MNELINAISNAITGASCLFITYQLVRFLLRRWQDGIPFRETMILAAALFFFFSGLGRTVLAFLIHSDTVDVISRLTTALLSLIAAVLVTLSINRALKMRTPRDFEELTAEKDRQLNSLRYELKLLVKKPQHGRQRN